MASSRLSLENNGQVLGGAEPVGEDMACTMQSTIPLTAFAHLFKVDVNTCSLTEEESQSLAFLPSFQHQSGWEDPQRDEKFFSVSLPAITQRSEKSGLNLHRDKKSDGAISGSVSCTSMVVKNRTLLSQVNNLSSIPENKACRPPLARPPLARDGLLKNCSISAGRVRRKLESIKQRRFTPEQLKEKFLYAVRMVRLMVALNNALKATTPSPQSIEQLNYYSMETEFAVEKLVFKKANFAASNITCVPGWARYMLALHPNQRSGQDVTRLASMMRTLRYFKNELQFDKLEDMCRHSSFALYEKRRTIIRTGHTAQFAYLLMSGSVFVNIEEKSRSDEKKNFVRTAAVLQRGSLFGEIAVINGITRTATIVSRERVECLVMDTETCMRIFPEAINRDFQRKLHHMRASGLFSDWPHVALKALCLVSKKVEHTYGVVIDRNSATSEFIYMLTKGRLELMHRVKYTSDKQKNLAEDVVSISHLISKPPNHAFLPPLPDPSSRLLVPSRDLAKPGQREVFMSMNFLAPYECCDMLSLVKSKEHVPLVLVSRGCEVIRMPKLRLQTVPPSPVWKTLLEKAKTYPRYPSGDILMQIYLEYRQWSSYRKLVIQDVLKFKPSFLSVTVPKKVTTKVDAKAKENGGVRLPDISEVNCQAGEKMGFTGEDERNCQEQT